MVTKETDPLKTVFQKQLAAYNRDSVPNYEQRIEQLKKLKEAIEAWEGQIVAAISADFAAENLGGRASVETIFSETFLAIGEIKHSLKHLKKWMKVKRVSTPIHFLPARAEIRMEPLGVVGILSPWNYPFQLAINPLVPALAAGNRVMLKPSEHTPRTSILIAEMLHSIFDQETVYVANGGVDVAAKFSELPFHHIFFTGSTMVGKIIAQAAAKNLTPVTLELGGKSPVIIDDSADYDTTAQRLAYGKLFNAGQTCTAADYILMPKNNIDEFANKIILASETLFPTWAENDDYTSVINDRQYQRLIDLIEDAKSKGATIRQAGNDSANALAAARKIPLSLILGATPDMRVMQEEVFGPLLSIVACDSPEQAAEIINKGASPLALYWFGNNKTNQEKVVSRAISGGVSINDTLLHAAHPNLPFGGIGESGMGAYHGDYGFKTFSHARSFFIQSKFSGGKMLYPPYGKTAKRLLNLMKKFS